MKGVAGKNSGGRERGKSEEESLGRVG